MGCLGLVIVTIVLIVAYNYLGFISVVVGLIGCIIIYAIITAITSENKPSADFLNKGTFTDPRDGKTYKTVNIGGKTWMAENLNYECEGSKCYNNDPANADKYGRLYDWETAKKASPPGWHLPSDTEWNYLVQSIGGAYTAGTSLASVNWVGTNDNGERWVGTDKYGFSALPGGYGNSDDSFCNVDFGGYWWVASYEWNADYSYGKDVFYSIGVNRRESDGYKVHFYSIRCVKD